MVFIRVISVTSAIRVIRVCRIIAAPIELLGALGLLGELVLYQGFPQDFCLFVLVRNSRTSVKAGGAGGGKKLTFTLKSVRFFSFPSIKLPRKGLMVISLADLFFPERVSGPQMRTSRRTSWERPVY